MRTLTLEQIASTPKSEYISTQFYNQDDFTMYCPFCGKRLIRHSEGWGRDKMVWYDDCVCEGAKKAHEHNALVEDFRMRQKVEKTPVLPNVSNETPTPTATSYRGSHSFNDLIAILKREGLYVSHTTFGEPLDIDGIMIGYMSDMHKKVVIIDDNTTFQSYNWDLCISFMSENNSQNPIMNVVNALGYTGRPYQHVVVSDVKKAREVLKDLF